MNYPLQPCARLGLAFITIFYVTSVAYAQPAGFGNSDGLVVHEWGTFTCLHDEDGNAIGGINADDEPVPEFVHRIGDFLVIRHPGNLPALVQGAPRCHPHVTMRLETPVVYFHPPEGVKLPMQLNVEVAFRGGWLSEYYPDAEVEAPGVKGRMSFGPITRTTVGRLRWRDLQVGTEKGAGPETKSKVWLTPRAVEAANVTTPGGERERYLFYRGVGNVDSPLRVSRNAADKSLMVTANFSGTHQRKAPEFLVPALWLVEIRDDKSCAFREIEGFQVTGGQSPRVVAATPGHFDESDFDSGKLDQLISAMRAALIEDGLYADEADALLNTWKLSYFETLGLRLFYLLPREWTDHVLPMQLSHFSDLVRTMVGRIEIVTPEQRQLLSRISAGPASTAKWLQDRRKLAPPDDYVAYQGLGRFRNAIILDEYKHRPTPALKTFIDGYGLWGFTPSDLASAPARAKN